MIGFLKLSMNCNAASNQVYPVLDLQVFCVDAKAQKNSVRSQPGI